jgi:hypothetical protein
VREWQREREDIAKEEKERGVKLSFIRAEQPPF